MYRLGHTGIALLVLAPLSYGLLEAHKPLLALITTLGVLTIEPLPDFDFKLPFLAHRGISHSLFAAVSVGGLLALCGWFVGMQGVTILTSVLGVTTEVVTTVATSLESLALPETTGSIVAWIVGLLTDVAATLDWIVSQLQTLDRETIAGVGFVIGAGGILVHLLGDVLTVSGIQPFLPLSDWNLSVSSLRANSTLANTGFFAVGALAIAVVLTTTVASIGVAVAPADISPVGVAAGQDASGPQNGSVTIHTTETNRTQIVLETVTLPQNGYIVAQTGNLSVNESATRVVGHTQYVRNGTFDDVILRLNQSVAKGTTVAVTIHNDTNRNRAWDGVKTDTPYTSGGTPVHDTVRLGSGQNTASQNQNTSTNATVTFANQTTNGSTVTVERVTLPASGFVVLDSTGPDEEGVLEESAIAVSQRLSAGTHRNVTIRVNHSPPGGLINRTTLNHTGTYEVILYRDSNNNSRFEFITSGRSVDRPFVVGSGATARLAADAARITIPQPQTPTPTASIRFTDQSVTDSTVTVQSVTLPEGGFVVVHDESYLRGGDPLQTAIGLSSYLSPGTHRNVTVALTNGSVQQDQTLVAIPSRDTNGNQTYDYVRSGGFQDVPYTAGGEVLTDRASVSAAETPAVATPTATSTAGQADNSQPATGKAAGNESGIGGWLSANPLVVVVIAVPVVMGVIFLIRRQ